jgi:hypothetical protein
MSETLRSANCFESATDHQTGSDLVGVVTEAVLEQLGIGEDDAELVVQPVEEPRDLGLGGLCGGPSGCGGIRRHG